VHTEDATDIKEVGGLHVEMHVLTIIWNGSLGVAECLRVGLALRIQFSCAEGSPRFRLRIERQPLCSFGGIRRCEDFRRRVTVNCSEFPQLNLRHLSPTNTKEYSVKTEQW
jgi:hypothetical protein